MISERTKAALKAAKVRGKRLGNPRLPGVVGSGSNGQKAGHAILGARQIVRSIGMARQSISYSRPMTGGRH
jgi:DNA invertase Pin-like site-specific DNA recombinase